MINRPCIEILQGSLITAQKKNSNNNFSPIALGK